MLPEAFTSSSSSSLLFETLVLKRKPGFSFSFAIMGALEHTPIHSQTHTHTLARTHSHTLTNTRTHTLAFSLSRSLSALSPLLKFFFVFFLLWRHQENKKGDFSWVKRKWWKNATWRKRSVQTWLFYALLWTTMLRKSLSYARRPKWRFHCCGLLL